MKSLYIILTIALFACSACQKLVLGPEAENTPTNNFELLWNDYDRHSGILYPKNINWDSIYQVYQPQVSEQTTDAELWKIFTEMIEYFDDEHTFVTNPATGETYVSGSHRIEKAIASFSKDLVRDTYLEYQTIIETAPDMNYGKIKGKDIGYIYLGDTDGNHPEQTMDEILAKIGSHKAIIFDVRNNGGGDGTFAFKITKAFADGDQRVMSVQTRNGPNHDDFDEKTYFSNVDDGVNQYKKPVIVLTDRFSVSGAEHVTLYLKSNAHITHMGDTTAGAFSSTASHRFLPNGWQYQYPGQSTLTLDGVSLDGEGLIPDVLALNTPEDIVAKQDVVLEKAFQYLFDTYGIE